MNVLHPLPIILPTSIVYPAVTPNGTEISANYGIRNTESVGVLVDKITVVSAVTSAWHISLRWRNQPITNGFTALAGISYPQNRDEEVFVASIKLSRPMYLAPGDYISTSLRNDMYLNPGETVSITAIGRQAEEPAEKWIPYLTSYTGPIVTDSSGAAISNQSSPPDLGNPFDTPLFVERMIGRVLTGAAVTQFSDLDPASVWNTHLIRVSDHKDNFWVAQPTPLPLVFNAVDRSWLMNTEIESKGFIRVEEEGTANVAGVGFSRAVVGLVGYRRIS